MMQLFAVPMVASVMMLVVLARCGMMWWLTYRRVGTKYLCLVCHTAHRQWHEVVATFSPGQTHHYFCPDCWDYKYSR